MTNSRAQTAVAALLGAFVLYTGAFGAFDMLLHRSIFVAIIIALGLLSFPLWDNTRYRPAGLMIDVMLGLASIIACVRIALEYDQLMRTLPFAEPLDIALCAALVLTVIDLCRRTVGWSFTLIVIAGILYAAFGHNLPGALGHRGVGAPLMTEVLYLGDLGVWGSLVGISATILAVFVIYGSLLLYTGAGQTFINLSVRIGGNSPGGAAKVAALASGLFGMLAGSSVANVATTGNVTIPMMKRLNYPPMLAGAIEALASTGGQFVPPILGAAAFVMAELLSISYWDIAIAAIVPCILFYMGLLVTIHLIALKQGLRRVEGDELPSAREAFGFGRITPLVVSVGSLAYGIWNGNSIVFSVFLGIAGLVVSHCLVNIRSRESTRTAFASFAQGILHGAKGLFVVGILLVGAQVLVSLINLTGLAPTLASLLVTLAGSNLFIMGVLSAVIGLVMGMGLPTIAAYVLVAAIAAPALQEVGASGLSAHMLVFYYATLSAITPPVCVAVFIAAGIAETSWTRVAAYTLKLGAVAYILPLLFLFYPGILGQGSDFEVLADTLTAIAITLGLSILLGNRRVFRFHAFDYAYVLLALGLAIYPRIWLDVISVSMMVAFLLLPERHVPLAMEPVK